MKKLKFLAFLLTTILLGVCTLSGYDIIYEKMNRLMDKSGLRKKIVDSQKKNPVDTTAPMVTIVAGPTEDVLTNASFTVILHVDEDFGYWSTNNSPFQPFGLGNTAISIVSTTTLKFYGKDSANNASVIQTRTYLFKRFIFSTNMIPQVAAISAVTSFSMGGPAAEGGGVSERPIHAVNLSNFSMAKYETTVGQYCAFLNAGGNGDHYRAPMSSATYCGITKVGDSNYTVVSGRSNYPVTYVSWIDATNYCVWLSEQTGAKWELPTEAEWEYAASGKPHKTFPWGDTWQNTYCNNGIDYISGVIDGYGFSSPVGYYSSGQSPLGIYDMSGNILEWCNDWYDSGYYQYCMDNMINNNPQGPLSGASKVLRGGSFLDGSLSCRASYRNRYIPSYADSAVGFRVVKH